MITVIITLLSALCAGVSFIGLAIMCLMDMEHLPIYGTLGYLFLGGFLGMIISGQLIGCKMDEEEMKYIDSLSPEKQDEYMKRVYIPKHSLKNKMKHGGR